MIRGTRKNSPARSGAFASASSRGRHAASTSSRITFTIGTACEVGSTFAVSSSLSLSMYARMPLSCSRIFSSSASVSASRASLATCSTSFRSITSVDLFQMRVLHRQALAPDAREAHRHHHVLALALHADHEALAEAIVTHVRADLEGQVVVDGAR